MLKVWQLFEDIDILMG